MKALTLHQFTFIGAPHIFNGDEMGMYGGDDPDNRKPLWWNEFNFDAEHFMVNNQSKSYTPKSNENMMEHYRKLIQLRKENVALANGEITYLRELNKFLAYKRHDTDRTLIVVINVSKKAESLNIESYGDIVFEIGNNQRFNGNKSINLDPYGGIVFRKNNKK
jgi:glycosidase